MNLESIQYGCRTYAGPMEDGEIRCTVVPARTREEAEALVQRMLPLGAHLVSRVGGEWRQAS